jgi:hypothetical protein
MSIERRLAKRYATQEKVRLFLRDETSLQRLTEPVTANLFDISSGGAGIRLAQVIIDRNHIFYAPLDSPGKILCLEFSMITTDDGDPFVIPVRPVWLDRSLEDHKVPFRIGVEFLEKFPKDILKIVLQS